MYILLSREFVHKKRATCRPNFTPPMMWLSLCCFRAHTWWLHRIVLLILVLSPRGVTDPQAPCKDMPLYSRYTRATRLFTRSLQRWEFPKMDLTADFFFFQFFLKRFFFIFFPPSHLLLSSPFLSCSLLRAVATQIRGHIAPRRYVPCIFVARRTQHFLPSSTRARYNRRSRQLVSFDNKKLHIRNTEIRTHDINARLSGVRG